MIRSKVQKKITPLFNKEKPINNYYGAEKMKVDEQRRKIDFYKYSQSRNSSENNHEFFYSKFKNYANAFFLNKKTNNFERENTGKSVMKTLAHL